MNSDRFKEIYSELIDEGFSRSDIAQKLGKDQSTITRWLSGKIAIPDSMMLLIESKFDYRVEWQKTGELPKKINPKEIFAEVSRISKQGRDMDKIPEIRDLVPKILKMKKEDYDMLVEVIIKFLK